MTNIELQQNAIHDIMGELQYCAEKFGFKPGDRFGISEKLREWVGIPSDDDNKIVTWKVDGNKANIVIVTKQGDERYSLYRLFKIAGEWAVSIDATGHSDDIIDKLVKT